MNFLQRIKNLAFEKKEAFYLQLGFRIKELASDRLLILVKKNSDDFDQQESIIRKKVIHLLGNYKGEVLLIYLDEIPVLNGDVDIDKIDLTKTSTFQLIEESSERKVINKDRGRISPADKVKSYPLSFAQKRVWIMSQFEGSNETYNMPFHVTLNGNYNIVNFKRAIFSTIERHEILRTIFKEDESGEIRQWVLSINELNFLIKELDFRQEKNKDQKIKSFIEKDSFLAFKLDKGPLLRVVLIQIEKDQYVLYYNMHHIISDAWSIEVLSKNIFEYYEAYENGQDPNLSILNLQYKDYACWQLKQIETEDFKNHKSYWLNKFQEEIPLIELPTNKKRPLFKTYSGRKLRTYISKEDSSRLMEFTQEKGGTLFMGLFSVMNALFYRYTSQDKFVVGSPVAGREHSDLEDQIGFYVNTLALKTQVNGDHNFDQLFEEIKRNSLDAYAHQNYPFDLLVDELKLKRDVSRNMLFDIMFTLQNIKEDERNIFIEKDEADRVTDHGPSICKFDIHFTFQQEGEYISFAVNYNSDVYEHNMMEAFMIHYKLLLTALLENRSQPLNGINYLSELESRKILVDFNFTKAEYPRDKTIVELFEEQVKKTPGNIAVIFQEKQFTYAEINEHSNQLARYLKSNYSIEPDNLVAIKLERSEWMIITILGILKAGGAYVPIDPTYPEERINFMIKDSECKLVVDEYELIKYDKERNNYSNKNLDCVTQHFNLAYVIYTSGSTGRPKGVMIENQALINYTNWFCKKYKIQSSSVTLLLSNYTFDGVYTSVYGALLAGGCLHIIPSFFPKDGEALYKYIVDNKIVFLKLTPSHFNLIFSHEMAKENLSQLTNLRLIIIGGESIRVKDIEEFHKINPQVELLNHYGPTESTIGVCCYTINENINKFITCPVIGFPIFNTQIYILNTNFGMNPIGVTGEIYISGDGLARGYLNKADLTAEKFVNHPFIAGERLYKTGDLGRWLADGSIEFIGRKDDQVKIRGYRIELGEIENILQSHPLITQAVVLAKEEEGGGRCLVGYVVSKEKLNIFDLRNYLSGVLPEYMLPAHFIQLEKLPTTANGKTDKKILLSSQDAGMDIGIKYEAPRNEIEEKLIKIWQEALGNDKSQIGIDNGFFLVGGNSLRIIQLKSKIEKTFSISISIASLFQSTTIRLQAGLILNGKFNNRSSDKELDELNSIFQKSENSKNSDIAVIGMSIRVPGADGVQEFWNNLKNGVESIEHHSEEDLLDCGIPENLLKDKNYVRASSYLNDKEYFDSSFFGYLPDEARLMDPQIRIFHECVWKALEDAGYDPLNYDGLIGLYAGASSNIYWEAYSILTNKGSVDEFTASHLRNKDFANSLLAFKLNLKGAVSFINTACSTSLVCIHNAVRSLLTGENHIAIAGGVSVRGSKKTGYLYQEGMIMSKDGHNRAFDSLSSGTIGGEGAGAVVLKRMDEALKDGDNILAVIKGSAINNDGNRKVGFTAPSVDGQSDVIRQAQKIAGVSPSTISYIEAHGTATKIGDPIEVEALIQTFGKGTEKYCGLGTVKSNIGHLDAAAGVAGFIKAVLCLKNKQLVPSLHYHAPNAEINFGSSPFYVVTELKEWRSKYKTLRAGVSSFGIGGTNAHIILEEAPIEKERNKDDVNFRLIILSAKTKESLTRQLSKFGRFLQDNKNINLLDVCWTLATGRAEFSNRIALVVKNSEDAIDQIQNNSVNLIKGDVNNKKKKVAFMFSGQGSQYVNMGRGLYESESVFNSVMDTCFKIALDLSGRDLKPIIYPYSEDDNQLIHETVYSQPILFILEYALSKQLEYYDIVPDIMIGHSLGEYVAACLSGVLSLNDALRLVIKRGEMMQGLPGGMMLRVDASADEIIEYLPEGIDIAAVNTKSTCVISGGIEEVSLFSAQLAKKNIATQKLQTSHAFHSSMMNPILNEFEALVTELKINEPKVPYISNLTGKQVIHSELKKPNYWSNHIRQTVNFSKGIDHIQSNGDVLFIEIGPGKALTAFVSKHQVNSKLLKVVNTMRHSQQQLSDQRCFLDSIGKLWTYGVEINWNKVYKGQLCKKISLPTYCFEKMEYPLGENIHQMFSEQFTFSNEKQPSITLSESLPIHNRPLLENDYIMLLTETEKKLGVLFQSFFGMDKVGRDDDFFELGGDSLKAMLLLNHIHRDLGIEVSLTDFLANTNIGLLAKEIDIASAIKHSNNNGEGKKNEIII